MKLFLMPGEPSWWVWLVTDALLIAGVGGWPAGFLGAIALSAAQSVYYLAKLRSLGSYTVQVRVAYTVLLIACLIPSLRFFYWVPLVGTLAMLVFGYCPMARFLSLMPWNRREGFSLGLLRRTFFSAPVIGRPDHGLAPGGGCAGGVCELEFHAARPGAERAQT